MTGLSIGKWRGLQQFSTSDGVFMVFALDHRQNLRRVLNPEDPNQVSDAALIEFKLQVTSALAPHATGVLLDPEYGAAPAIASGAVPGSCGLLVAVEQTGYDGEPTARLSRILEKWGVDKVRRMGASAVKLLVYYHPESATAAAQEALVQEVATACKRYDLPFCLEPLSFALEAGARLRGGERTQVIAETARRLTPLGVDLLKAEFPADTDADIGAWARACRELDDAVTLPWAVLSAGVDFSTFLRQAEVACQAGASGVVVGRAVWSEAVTSTGPERERFLQEVAPQRMAQLTQVCRKYGTPWTERVGAAPQPDARWYQSYGALA